MQFQQIAEELVRLDPRSPSHHYDTQAGFSALLRWAAQIPADASHARQAAREAVRSAIHRSQSTTGQDSTYVDSIVMSYIRTFGRGAASEPLWVLSLSLHLGQWPSQEVADAAATCLMRSGHTDTALKLLLAYPDLGHVHSDACIMLLHEALEKKTAFASMRGGATASSPPSSELGQAIVDMLLASFQNVETDSAAAAGVLKALVCSAAHGSEAAGTAAQALMGHLARASPSQNRKSRGVDVAVVLQVVLEYAVRLVVRHHAVGYPPLHTPWDPLVSERAIGASVTHVDTLPPPPPDEAGSGDTDPPPPPAPMPEGALRPKWNIADPDIESSICKLAEGLVAAVLSVPSATVRTDGIPPSPPKQAVVRNPLVSPPALGALLGVFTVCNMPSRSRQLLPMLRCVQGDPPFTPRAATMDDIESGTQLHSALCAASLSETQALQCVAADWGPSEGGEGGARPWLLPLLTPRYASGTLQTMQYIRRAGIQLTTTEQALLARAAGWQWQALRVAADGGAGDAEMAAAANAIKAKGVKGASKAVRSLLVGGSSAAQGLLCPSCGVASQGGGKAKRRGGVSVPPRSTCVSLDRSGMSAVGEQSDDDGGGVPAGAAARAARRASSLWPSRLLPLLEVGGEQNAQEGVLQPLLLAAAATPCSKEAEHVFQLLFQGQQEGSPREKKVTRARLALYALWRWWAHLHAGDPQLAKRAWKDVVELVTPFLAREMQRRFPELREPHAGDLMFVCDMPPAEQQRIGSSVLLGHSWMYLCTPSALECSPAFMLRASEAGIARSFQPPPREGAAAGAPLDRDALGSALTHAFAAAACRCLALPVDSIHSTAPVEAPGRGQGLAPPRGSPLAEQLEHSLQRGLVALGKAAAPNARV